MGPCPRCGGSLAEAPEALGCAACGGVFVRRAALEGYLERLGTIGQATSYRTSARAESDGRPRGAFEAHVAYLICPICGKRMNRENLRRAGVIVDTCIHGVWFDADEPSRVAAVKT